MRWRALGDRRQRPREPDLSEVRSTSDALRRLALELEEARRRTREALVMLMGEDEPGGA